MSDDWQKQVDWMRKNGVVSAKWTEDAYGIDIGAQRLVECVLGPAPTADVQPMTADAYKAHLEEVQRQAAAEIERLDTGAS